MDVANAEGTLSSLDLISLGHIPRGLPLKQEVVCSMGKKSRNPLLLATEIGILALCLQFIVWGGLRAEID